MTYNILIDSSNHKTDLCSIGEKVETDKSPYCPEGHRHPYTAVYNLLFAHLRNKDVKIAEIGVYRSASMKLWSEFFPNGAIYGFDFNQDFLENCRKSNIPNVNVFFMDVKNKKSIDDGFSMLNESLDVIIDDSSHELEDEIRIVDTAFKYLNSGGYFIIEDIYESIDENIYLTRLSKIIEECSFFSFITCGHKNGFTDVNNNKMLVLVKK